jgi:hypothetical protein
MHRPSVKEYRLIAMPRLTEALHARSLERYDVCEARLAHGARSLITPPVLAKHGEMYLGIEGVTRCYLERPEALRP